MTFSLPLAKHIVSYLDTNYEISLVEFIVGKKLEKGEKSNSGLYALVSIKNDWVLRISTIKDAAEMMVGDSCYLAECWLKCADKA